MWQKQNMKSESAIHLLNFIIKTVFAAEPYQISFLYFLFYLRTGTLIATPISPSTSLWRYIFVAGGYNALADIHGGAQQDRVIGGTQSVSIAMAK